jgi:hypothetical protein
MSAFHTPLEVLQAAQGYISLEVLDAREAELEELEQLDREREKGGSWAFDLGPVCD